MNLIIGVMKVELYMNDVFSLKEKRQIIKSIIERIKAKFKISVAEVSQNDIWKNAIIGVSVVSNDKTNVESIINKVFNFIENDSRIDIINCERENIYFN